MITLPSSVSFEPAMARKRLKTFAEIFPEILALKRSWTAVETLFTCWPPGPDDLINDSFTSDSLMYILSVIFIMLNT